MSEETTIVMEQFSESKGGKLQFSSPDLPKGQDVCNSYFSPKIFTEGKPDYLNLVVFAEEPAGTLVLEEVSGKNGDGNYGIYETESGAITALYLSRDALGVSSDASASDFPQEIPFALEGASEEDFSEVAGDAEAALEEEAANLMG